MDTAQSEAAFKQAQALFQSGRYPQCVELLLRINEVHPDDYHILFPLARSLAKSGKTAEAVRVCDRLIEKFNHEGAQALRNELQPPAEPTLDLDFDSLDVGLELDSDLNLDSDGSVKLDSDLNLDSDGGLKLDSDLNLDSDGGVKLDSDLNLDLDGGLKLDIGLDLDSGPTSSAFGKPPPLPQASAASEWIPYALWVGPLVGFFILRLVMMQTLGADTYAWFEEFAETEAQADIDAMPPFPFASLIYLAIPNIVYEYFLACFVAYFALKSLHELQHEEFSEDMKDVGLYTLFCLPLVLLPFFGWLAIVVILMRHYNLPFGKTAVVIFVWLVFYIVVNIPLEFITGQFFPVS